MIKIKMFKSIFITFLLCMIFVSSARASIIQRTITVDNNGSMTDWTTAPNIITNAGQFSTDALESAAINPPPNSQADCIDLDADYSGGGGGSCSIGQTGRDLKHFAYTYDANYLYLYVERHASTTNTTEWFFYLDTDSNGSISNTERVFRVEWFGSNAKTVSRLYVYDPSGSNTSDTIVAGDGYTMPGSLGTEVTGYAESGEENKAAANGVQMESRIPWSQVCSGCSGPQSLLFHVSSSNNNNLPSGILDNMNGPAGGIITYDLAVAKTSSANAMAVGSAFSYTVTVTNNSASTASSVTLTDVLPAQVTFGSFSGTGSYNSGTGLWTIGTLAGSGVATATFNVTANATGTPTNTATLTLSDTNDANNSASKQVTINAAGDLSVSKTVDDNNVTSGDVFTYTLTVTNNGLSSAAGITLADILPADVTFSASNCTAGTYNSGTGIWTIGTINAAATVSCDIDVIADAVVAVTVNTNTATLSYSDGNNANNTASVDVTINPPLPLLSITKVSSASTANPLEVITYTITVQNMGAAAAVNIEINDDMSPYSAIDIDADDAGPLTHPFLFNAGTSTLAMGAKTYTQNNGADAYGYSLTSGASGASSGFDGSATDWRIQMSGSMPTGTSFTITYDIEIK